MVIDKVHGLQATSISLNDRFSLLATAAPVRAPVRQKRRDTVSNFVSQNLNFRNRNLIEQIARKLEQQAKRTALRQRLGVGRGGLRRFGSESSIVGLQRSNSSGNLNQDRNVKARIGWKQSNGNLSRSASFINLSGGSWGGRPWRGLFRRGGTQRPLRLRFIRGGRQNVGRGNHIPQRWRPGLLAGGGRSARGQAVRGQVARGQAARGQAARGRGRGGILRNQPPKVMFTKEELDAQLEQYMAGTKAALDKDLDVYMKNALETQ